MTLSEALGWMRTLKTRHNELVNLRDANSSRTTRHWGVKQDEKETKEPTYSVVALDRRVTLVAREMRLLDEAIKRTNAVTVIPGYERDENVLGELEG